MTTKIYCICVSILMFTTTAFSQAAQPPAINVNGTAEVNVVPDSALFTVGVEKINKEMSAAKSENDAAVAQLLSLTKKFGIAEKDVKTDYISVNKRYEFVGVGRDRKRVFVGYAVSKTVIVKLKALDKFEDFFSELLTTGVTAVRSVYFQSSEFQKHKRETRLKAMKAAKQKAEEMAAAIGQGIGKAILINENSARFVNSNITANYVGAIATPRANTGQTFSPGTITIRSQVNVRFMLE